MRKIQHLLLTAAMLLVSLVASAQAKMTIELKNGTSLSFYVSEIQRISWTDGNDNPGGGDNDPGEQTVTFYTGDATNINCYSAKVSAQMIVESSSVYQRLNYGICYGTTAEPTTQQQVTSKDASGTYTTTLKGLAGGTVYYYRPYADMDGTVFYGPVSSFRTSDDNVVETGEADKLGFVRSKLTIGGGAYSQLVLGVCFSMSNSMPTVSDNTRTINEVDDDNCYTLNVVKEFGTTYYRSYVEIDGTAHYGAVKQVTINMPTIATSGAVDLGLSVKWATTNVGASSPGDYGDYYAWGETETKSTYNWDTYFDSNYEKYATNKKTKLDQDDDVAHVKWGGSWRMPTKAEQDELREKCAWVWTTYGGHNGYVVVGSTGNAIFLPAAGFRNVSSFSAGSFGYYWSSSLYEGLSDFAYELYFGSGYVLRSLNGRNYGRSVRPVCP